MIVPARSTFVGAFLVSALPLAACADHHTGVKSTISTTTDANGHYSVETATLTPPFLVEVDGGDGHQHHTVAFTAGVANATLLSDFVVNALCVAQDVPISDWMADPSGSDPPSECAVDLLVSQLDHALGCWIQMHQLDPTTLDFLREPFAPHAAGLGALLDHVSVGEGGLQVQDETTTQWTNFVGGPPSVSRLETTIQSPAGLATSVHQTLIPAKATSAMHDAIVGANTLLNLLADQVNTRGASLTAGDLLPLFASDCLEDGDDAGLLCARLATFLRGVHVDSIRVIRTYDYDDVDRVLVENSDGVSEVVDSVETLAPTATTGHLQLPLHLKDGSDVVYVELNLALTGLDGERSVVVHAFERPPIQMTRRAPQTRGVWGLR